MVDRCRPRPHAACPACRAHYATTGPTGTAVVGSYSRDRRIRRHSRDREAAEAESSRKRLKQRPDPPASRRRCLHRRIHPSPPPLPLQHSNLLDAGRPDKAHLLLQPGGIRWGQVSEESSRWQGCKSRRNVRTPTRPAAATLPPFLSWTTPCSPLPLIAASVESILALTPCLRRGLGARLACLCRPASPSPAKPASSTRSAYHPTIPPCQPCLPLPLSCSTSPWPKVQ
jgi:hypothetical protein